MLQPGQIIGQDLSPNANILGTQIADKTLQFRNFSEDVFKIVGEPTITLNFTVPDTNFHHYSASYAHGLSFTPAFIAMLSTPDLGTVSATGQTGNPHFLYDNVAGIKLFGIYYISISATNVTFNFDASNIAAASYTATAKVYLLQETFN